MSIDNDLDYLTVATKALVTHFGDVAVRGYIKEHPDSIDHVLDIVSAAVEKVRAAVAADRATGTFPPLPREEVIGEHVDMVVEYAEHSCDCEFCLHMKVRGDTGEPIICPITLTAEQVARIEAGRV